MAFVDLGAPCGLTVAGEGAYYLADKVGGNAVAGSGERYSEWVNSTKNGTIAPECGAFVLDSTVEVVPGVEYGDGFGSLKVAS